VNIPARAPWGSPRNGATAGGGYLWRGTPTLLALNAQILAQRTRTPGECGTEGGARRHVRRGEKICERCSTAAYAAKREREEKAAARGRIEHGTTSGYTSQRCRCERCRQAHAADMRQHRAERREAPC
jgi:hypothetical protein